MKRLATICLIFLYGTAFSQTIKVSENEEQYAQRVRSAFFTTIYDNNIKEIKRELLLFLEQHKCEQTHENGPELYAHNVFLKNVLNKPVDVYYKLVEHTEEKNIILYAAVDIGASNYLSSDKYPAESKELIHTLKEFAYRVSRTPAEGYLLAAQSHQIKLTGELQQFEKERIRLEEKLKTARDKENASETVYRESERQIPEFKLKVSELQNTLEPDTVKSKSAVEKRKAYEEGSEQLTALQKKTEKQKADWQRAKDKRAALEEELNNNAKAISGHHQELNNQKSLEEKWKKRLEEFRME